MKSKWIISTPEYLSDNINKNLAVSPWSGHRNFAYDLLNFLEADKIVELGTHYGCSFFAMAQSIKENTLKTKLYAVDTWEGDEQAGFYGDEVLATVKKTIQTYFSDVPFELKRMLFDDAVNDFDDGQIDIIHIDGLHTYEAVSNDFYKWLPKLKENGIILLHDIASKLGYGTNTFWKELISNKDYRCLEFTHSWGLGIVFPKGLKLYNELIKQNIEDKIKIYEYYSTYIVDEIKITDMEKMINDRDECIIRQKEMIDDRDSCIISQTKLIDERDAYIKELEDKLNSNKHKNNKWLIKKNG